MELWIRSQNRMGLCKPLCIDILNDIEISAVFDYKEHNRVELGTYATKERALEVLDEIQSIIETHVGKSASDMGQIFYSNTVYEMPGE